MQNRIKQLRDKLGLSQIEFAKRLNVTNQTVSLWETGKVPVLETVRYRIEKEFNVSHNWLETGEGNVFIEEPSPLETLNEINLLVELARRSVDKLDEKTKEIITTFVIDLAKKLSDDTKLSDKDGK